MVKKARIMVTLGGEQCLEEGTRRAAYLLFLDLDTTDMGVFTLKICLTVR